MRRLVLRRRHRHLADVGTDIYGPCTCVQAAWDDPRRQLDLYAFVYFEEPFSVQFVRFIANSSGVAAVAPPAGSVVPQTNDHNSARSSGADARFICSACVPPVRHKEHAKAPWQCLLHVLLDFLRLVTVVSGTAHKIEFADRAATRALRADSDGVSVIGTSLEQLVTTADYGESLRQSLAAAPAGGGPSSEACDGR